LKVPPLLNSQLITEVGTQHRQLLVFPFHLEKDGTRSFWAWIRL